MWLCSTACNTGTTLEALAIEPCGAVTGCGLTAGLPKHTTHGWGLSCSRWTCRAAASPLVISMFTSLQSVPVLHEPHLAPWPPSSSCRRWGNPYWCTVHPGAGTLGIADTEPITGLQMSTRNMSAEHNSSATQTPSANSAGPSKCCVVVRAMACSCCMQSCPCAAILTDRVALCPMYQQALTKLLL